MFKVLAPLLLVLSWPALSSEEEKLAEVARGLSVQFGGQLKQRLQQSMQEGGPLRAIETCNVQAPAVANSIGESAGWRVGRTSLRARHMDNRPDLWELTALLEFAKRQEAGEDVASMESYAVMTVSGDRVFRYIKAIPTVGICLSCHGDDVQDDVLAKIKQLYPDDQALGFNTGDIRGAFSLSRKLE